ncbi:bifunctional helix-turn-helix transcriptional regulator/GNAT family N-acetyltransferase [Luteithermobacter gelatinilyticus]|uniref:bifunctional helix-turn-helix transcriptional regulator/GNAT family N-acetyltransferase n=1 Tax=Luteithermobacter gelatinilyticus TaxID=2582913 RepID=UPI00110734ED|nr:bifunctional helix-turn-helix transcriptional regulator/GNAT family N-acetyltransferase [Luteithermobacter gelatinilyticus]
MPEELFFDLGLGTRLKRVYEMMAADMEKLYAEGGFDFRVRYFPVVYALSRKGALSIAEMADLSGLSHSAVSQIVKQLMSLDLLEMETGEDARSRILRLSVRGQRLVQDITPLWQAATRAIEKLRQASEADLLTALREFEKGLNSRSLYQRVLEEMGQKNDPAVDIVPFHVKYKDAWFEINREWLEKYFYMEEVDIRNLKHPEEEILARGGEIYFAVMGGEAVGCVALKYMGERVYEVSKMGVKPAARGLGIGGKLLLHVINRYRARGGRHLYLETSTKLPPAIALYKKHGFVEAPLRKDSEYARADYHMIYAEEQTA